MVELSGGFDQYVLREQIFPDKNDNMMVKLGHRRPRVAGQRFLDIQIHSRIPSPGFQLEPSGVNESIWLHTMVTVCDCRGHSFDHSNTIICLDSVGFTGCTLASPRWGCRCWHPTVQASR